MTAVMEPETDLAEYQLTADELAKLDGITFETVWVTPGLAKSWLSLNIENNRTTRETKIDEYAADMARGLWLMTGEAIKFDTDGNFVDGQHRLLAVIQASSQAGIQGVPMTVARGVPLEAVEVMDSGAARRFADALRMQEAVNRFSSAAIVRRVFMWDRGNPAGINGRSSILAVPTRSELMIKYRSDRAGFDAAASRGYDFSRQRMCSATAGGIMTYLLTRVDREAAHTFLDQVVAGANLGDRHPAHILRNRLFRERKLDTTVAMGLFIRAWNSWTRDEEVDKIQLTRKGELNNGNFPKINAPKINAPKPTAEVEGRLATPQEIRHPRLGKLAA